MWSTVTVAMTVGEIEATARELAGRQVDNVRYYYTPYGRTDEPTWDSGMAHALDYGIDLITPSGTIGITWSPYGQFGYGLDLVHGPLLPELSHAEFCSAAGEPPWAAILHEPITATRIHWLDVTWGTQDTTGPVAISLQFADSISIVLICGSWNEADKTVLPTGDDIVVVWQPELLPVIAPFLSADLPGS